MSDHDLRHSVNADYLRKALAWLEMRMSAGWPRCAAGTTSRRPRPTSRS